MKTNFRSMELGTLCRKLFDVVLLAAGMTYGLATASERCSVPDEPVKPKIVGMQVDQMDGQGGLDIVTADSSGKFNFYFNDGKGRFPDKRKQDLSATLKGLRGFEIKQIDWETGLDIIALSEDGFFYLLTNDGRGNFSLDRNPLNAEAYDVASFLINQSDWEDGYDITFVTKKGDVYVMSYADNGRFHQPKKKNRGKPLTELVDGNVGVLDMQSAQLDGETGYDLLVALTDGSLYLMKYNTHGEFHDPVLVNPGPKIKGLKQFEIAQMDFVGGYDVVCATAEGEFYVLFGEGNGRFSEPKRINPNSPLRGFQKMFLYDLNLVGAYDIVALNNQGELFFYESNGDGTFVFPKKLNPHSTYDGVFDLLIRQLDESTGGDVLTGCSKNLYLYNNQGDGILVFPQTISR